MAKLGMAVGLWGWLLAGTLAFADEPQATPVTASAPAPQEAAPASPPAADNAAGQPEVAQRQRKKSPSRKYMQLLHDESGRLTAMQTAVVRYRLPLEDGQYAVVDLIGAVHIGDAAYYDELNKLFRKYDVVLYELVAPEGTRVPKGGASGSGHPVGMMQEGMKDMLQLEHQLARVNYQKKNFVHADMSPDEFAQSMTDRNESVLGMFFRAMGHGIAQQQTNPGGSNDMAMLLAMFERDRDARALKLKRLFAEQFEDLEAAMGVFNGPDGSTIITERNKKALDVLAQQLKAGHTRLAIFYGAGHLPDMAERLEADFKARERKTRWLTAWDLRDARQKAAAAAESEK